MESNFKADYKNMTETRRIDKEVTIDGKRYLVKNIKISPIALNVELKIIYQITLMSRYTIFIERYQW